MVDLVEGHGGEVKLYAAQGISDVVLAVDQPALFAEDHIGALPIDVEHDAGKFREPIGDAVDKLAAVGQFRTVDHQADHQLSGHSSLAQIDMAHQTGAGRLVIGRNVVLVQKFFHKAQDLAEYRRLQGTILIGDHPMGTAGEKSTPDAGFSLGEGILGLVAVTVHRRGAQQRGISSSIPPMRRIFS